MRSEIFFKNRKYKQGRLFFLMNSVKLFEFKRKLDVLSTVEGFFEWHNSAKARKKTKTGLKTIIL